MTVAILMAAIILLYGAASLYVRKAHQYLEESDAPWERLYAAAQEVIEDPEAPQEAAIFSAAAVVCAGCGCVTRQILWDGLLCALHIRTRRVTKANGLSAAQRKAFNKVVINAIYYDSLRAPLSGFLLRKMVIPWLRAASEEEAPAKKATVDQLVKTARRAIGHRREGAKLLRPA